MALFIRQNDDRSKLQERLAAELQERAKQRAANDAGPDMVDDTEYMKDTKQTTSLAWVWIVISIAACVWLVVLNAKNV
jgi:thiaminase